MTDLAARLEFERLLTALSAAFVAVEPTAVDAEIEGWLGRLVDHLGVDRAGVSQISADGTEVRLTHFHGVAGTPTPSALLHAEYPWFAERVRRGEMIRLERIPDVVSPEAVAESGFALQSGLKSHLMLPLVVAGKPLGALAFGTFRARRAWPDDLVASLGLVAQVFAGALARKRAALEIREHSDFERLVTDLSSAFVATAPSVVDTEIERWLGRLVEFLGVDRASVAQVPADGGAVSVTHSRAVEGVPPLATGLTSAEFPWYSAQIRAGRTLRLERLPDDLPAEAVVERAALTRMGLKSNLVIPITVGGSTVGALAFGTFRAFRAWPDALVKRLQLVAEVIGQALARGRGWRYLEERLAFERLIADLLKAFVSVSAGELDDEIRRGLARLVAHFGLDRGSLGRFSDGGPTLTLTHRFARAGLLPAPAQIRLPWYLQALQEGRTIVVGSAQEMPGDLAALGLKAHLGIPLSVGGRSWGMIGLTSFEQARRWNAEEVQRLRLVGEIMMQAILRQESEEAMSQQRDELAHVARVAALGELTAALAHELNQPLAAIAANAQATRRVLAAGKPPDDLDEILGDISRDATRAGDLIRRLRALLRRQELERIPLDLNQTVRDIEPIARTEVRRHDAELTLALADGLRPVLGDAVQLQQVVLNLVRNAAEAMAGAGAAGQEVIVRTEVSAPDRVTLSVEDQGPAIDDSTFERLFTTFHTTKPGGLGMGLAISRSIVEAHGGHLWAERRHGGGLTVRFTVPVDGAPA